MNGSLNFGVLIYIQISDSWPSNCPFWWLGQLDAELVQIFDQKYVGARFVIECGRTRSGSFLDPLQQAELTAPAWEFVSGCFSLLKAARGRSSAAPGTFAKACWAVNEDLRKMFVDCICSLQFCLVNLCFFIEFCNKTAGQFWVACKTMAQIDT